MTREFKFTDRRISIINGTATSISIELRTSRCITRITVCSDQLLTIVELLEPINDLIPRHVKICAVVWVNTQFYDSDHPDIEVSFEAKRQNKGIGPNTLKQHQEKVTQKYFALLAEKEKEYSEKRERRRLCRYEGFY